MTFKNIARLIALISIGLFLFLGFFPQAYAPTYGVAADEGVQFLTRRAAPMFVAPAIILWVASTSPRGALRDAVASGVALTWLGVAISGVVAFSQGIANPMILAAAAVECVMAVLLWTTRKN